MTPDQRNVMQTPGGLSLLRSMLAGTAPQTVKTNKAQAVALKLMLDKAPTRTKT